MLPNTFPSLAPIVRCKSARIGYPHLYAALIESGEHNFMRLHATTPVCPKGNLCATDFTPLPRSNCCVEKSDTCGSQGSPKTIPFRANEAGAQESL